VGFVAFSKTAEGKVLPRCSQVPMTEPSVPSEKKAGGMKRRFVRTLLFVVTGEEQSNLVKGRIKHGPR